MKCINQGICQTLANKNIDNAYELLNKRCITPVTHEVVVKKNKDDIADILN